MHSSIARELSEVTRRIMNPGHLPADLDHMVTQQAMGNLKDQRGPELAAMLRHELQSRLKDGVAAANKEHAQATKAAQDKIQAQALQIQQLQGELRAAVDGKGLHENKALTEAARNAAGAERKIQALNEAVKGLSNDIASLKAELAGKDAAIAGYARDIEQLTTAVAHVNEDHDTQIQSARTFLNAARDNLDDRYGQKLPPFLKVVRDDLVRGLNCLAPKK